MAEGDPQTPDMTAAAQSAEEAAVALNTLQQSANNAHESINSLNSATSFARDMFSKFETALNGYNMSLKNVGTLTDQQAAQFGFLTSSIIGARKAFDGLGTIDTGNLRTVKDQIEELKHTISNSPMFDTVSKQVNAFTASLTNLGLPANEVKKAAIEGMVGLSKYAESFLESADNGLRLQNVMIQLAARTGTLGDIYRKAGEDLGDINSLLAQQNAIIAETVRATGLNEKQVESYYAALGTVPRALEENITGLAGANSSTNMLTATIKLATGTGQKYEEVIGDLRSAFKEYGMVGETALTFTARFSEISNKFGIELEDVRTHLMGAASAFKTFADAGTAAGRMSESLAGIMNDYVGELKNSGMSGEHASKVIKDMTDSVAGLSVAQKAFLSAQTGGQGGLMGAFQIEKMMREGKIDEVFDKVRNSMQKQFGKIVTLDEAASSPAAASQLQKQMLILQRGPLGGMVKSDQDAYRLLETFRAKQEGRAAPDQGARGLDPQGMQHAIERGTSIEEKSYTQLTAINANIAAIRRAADIPSLGVVQKAGTASTGSSTFLGADSSAQMAMRSNLQMGMATASEHGGAMATDYKSQIRGVAPINVDAMGTAAVDAVNSFQDWFKQIPTSLRAPLDTLKQAVMSGDKGAVESQIASMEKDIKEKRTAAAKMSKEEKQKALAAAQAEEDAIKGMRQWFEQYGTNPAGIPINPAAAVGAAPKLQPSPKKSGTASSSNLPTPEVYVTEDGATGRIKVQVNVKVLEDGGQGKSITPTF